jgi:hypothetical protein
METEIVDDIYGHCPMLDREMCEGECYDVQMVRTKMIMESILDFTLDREKADTICESCPFNQLTGPPVTGRAASASA